MLNIGFRAHDMGKMQIDNLSKAIGNYGFSSIQLALKKAVNDFDYNYGMLSPGLGNYIRDSFYKEHINISILGCYINPIHPDMKTRENELNKFKEHIKYAASFGCSIVGTETGSPLPNCAFTEDIYLEKTFLDFIESLKVLVKAAEKYGVIIAIEGVADKHTIYSHERMLRTLELVPSDNLGIIYDPVNFLPNDQIENSDKLMEEAFDLFAHKMVAIHAKDYTIKNGIKDGTLPAGFGLLNYNLLFKLIKKHKPYIDILLENNKPETITASLGFIREIKAAL